MRLLKRKEMSQETDTPLESSDFATRGPSEAGASSAVQMMDAYKDAKASSKDQVQLELVDSDLEFDDDFGNLQKSLPPGCIRELGKSIESTKKFMPGRRTWEDLTDLRVACCFCTPLMSMANRTLVQCSDNTFWVYCNNKKACNMTEVFRRLTHNNTFQVVGCKNIFAFATEKNCTLMTKLRWNGMWGLKEIGTCYAPLTFETSQWFCCGIQCLGVFTQASIYEGQLTVTFLYFDNVDWPGFGCKIFRSTQVEAPRGTKAKTVPFMTANYFGAVILLQSREDKTRRQIIWFAKRNAPKLRTRPVDEVLDFDRGVSWCHEGDDLLICDNELFGTIKLDLKTANKTYHFLNIARASRWGGSKINIRKIGAFFVLVAKDKRGRLHIKTYEKFRAKTWVVCGHIKPIDNMDEGIVLKETFGELALLDVHKLVGSESLSPLRAALY